MSLSCREDEITFVLTPSGCCAWEALALIGFAESSGWVNRFRTGGRFCVPTLRDMVSGGSGGSGFERAK
jgi:hypothetical protein